MAIVFAMLVVAGFLIHVMWLGSTYQGVRDDRFSFRTPDCDAAPNVAHLVELPVNRETDTVRLLRSLVSARPVRVLK